MNAAVQRRSFRTQWESYQTLWLDAQTNKLTAAIRSDLERELGPLEEDEPEEPLRCAIGWRSEQDPTTWWPLRKEDPVSILAVRTFDGLRICTCLGCGQRIAWKPAHGARVCGKRCAERVSERAKLEARLRDVLREESERRALAEARERERARRNARAKAEREAAEARGKAEAERWARRRRAEAEGRKVVFLQPDPAVIAKLAESIRQQLQEQHNIWTRFVGSTLVWNTWHVFEYTILNAAGGNLHVVLNGSGPGRAAWMLDVANAYEAVMKITGDWRRYA